MGIKYGFCTSTRGKRVNLGKKSLLCGCTARVYASDLSGSVSISDIGTIAPADVAPMACGASEGGCGTGGVFYVDSATYNVSTQNNPITIGCCSDSDADVGKLINTTVGGMTTSKEHTVSAQGKGEAWAIGITPLVDIIWTALATGNMANVSIEYPPVGEGWVPTSLDANLAIDDWQSGSCTWTYFEGFFTKMIPTGAMITSAGYDDSVTVSIATGRVDVTRSIQVWDMGLYGPGQCDPIEAIDAVCQFVDNLDGISLSGTLSSDCGGG